MHSTWSCFTKLLLMLEKNVIHVFMFWLNERLGGSISFHTCAAVSCLHAVCVCLVTDRRRGVQEVGVNELFPLRDTWAADAGGAHLREHLVEPLQGAVQVQLDPAGGAGHRLSPARDRGEQKQMLRIQRKLFQSRTCVSKLTKSSQLLNFHFRPEVSTKVTKNLFVSYN